MRKNQVVKMALTQPHHAADGTVLHQPGALFDEGDPLIAALPEGSFRPVVVDEEAAAEAEKEKAAEEKQVEEGIAARDEAAGEPTTDTDAEDDASPTEVAKPSAYAAKPAWVDYAVSKGADRPYAEGRTKEQLVTEYGA